MASILQFPSNELNGLTFLQQQVRALLTDRGADEQLIEFAASTLSDVYERHSRAENYNFELPLPEHLESEEVDALTTAVEAGIENIRNENHAIIVRLIAELVLAEVRNFQCRRELDT
jgi:hypothetical protein